MNESLYLKRCIFLETVAGVPGMIGGMLRHLSSLRGLKEDGGWIHHLLEEAENERMHLLTFLQIRQPNFFFRFIVLWSQFAFLCGYGALYLASPKTAHRLVGYLEEEAVRTYTNILKEIDEGKLPLWKNMDAPPIARKYWGLKIDAKLREVILCIRADEVSHREYNHHFSDMPSDAPIEGHHLVIVQDVTVDVVNWDEENENEKEKKKIVEDVKH
jgi:demethoxyubiquinone hydroxylase (CLK1/Coq7/Cat5 family)